MLSGDTSHGDVFKNNFSTNGKYQFGFRKQTYDEYIVFYCKHPSSRREDKFELICDAIDELERSNNDILSSNGSNEI